MDDYIIDGDMAFSSTSSALKFYREQYNKKKQWQGLTEDEVSKILDDVIGFNSCFGPETDFARAIEAKLKEKNT